VKRRYIPPSARRPGESVGGALDYQLLSEQFKPTSAAQLAAEIRRLHKSMNLTAQDLSALLNVNFLVVVEILARSDAKQKP